MLVFYVSNAEEMKQELIKYLLRLRKLEKIRPGDTKRNQLITEARSNLLHSIVIDLEEARVMEPKENNNEGSNSK